jgi:hypothetical protein
MNFMKFIIEIIDHFMWDYFVHVYFFLKSNYSICLQLSISIKELTVGMS